MNDPYRTGHEPGLTQDETTMAMLAHLLAMFGGGFIGPLVILLVKGKESRFVKFHALSSLIFSVAWFTALIVGMFGTMGAIAVFSPHAFGPVHAPGEPGEPVHHAGPPAAVFVLFPIMGGLMLTYFVTCIVLSIRAKDGKWSAFPGIGAVVRLMTR